jgi:hypothetical protein
MRDLCRTRQSPSPASDGNLGCGPDQDRFGYREDKIQFIAVAAREIRSGSYSASTRGRLHSTFVSAVHNERLDLEEEGGCSTTFIPLARRQK